jgi:four helix bundle protein
MANIAEGFDRGGTKELANFLSIAKGSIGDGRSTTLRRIGSEIYQQRTI